ncbi:uncharacterized protein [Mytilus edulis]|uniref:uncharacterized protein n=1 Tax=Mytilus edulis TaxID=6550 RepID=UPI0039EF75EB
MFFTSGKVRARLWTACDLPVPVFTHNTSMNALNASFFQLEHGLDYYPDLVSVRIMLDNGFMSDGQGAVFNGIPPTQDNCFSGLIYGYNQTYVRIWIPQYFSGQGTCEALVCCTFQDWSSKLKKRSGIVHILFWKFDTTYSFVKAHREIDTFSAAQHVIFSPWYLSEFYVVVEVESNVDGFRFPGAGSAMTNYDTFYGGIVYVYTNSSIEFWVPSLHGNIIYVDNLWGNGEYSYNDETGRIRVKQFGFTQYERINCNDGTCSPTYDSDDLIAVECNCSNINYIGEFCQTPTCNDLPKYENSHVIYNEMTNGSLAVYQCNKGFTIDSGDFVHYCDLPGWIGQSVVCIRTCPIPSSYIHSTRTYSGTIQGSLAVYACEPGYDRLSGDFVHICDSSNWVGNSPLCQETCAIPTLFQNTSRLYDGLTNGSVVTYTCAEGFIASSGNFVQICNSTHWVGNSPVCQGICDMPPEYNHTTYMFNGITDGSIAEYTCNNGHFHVSGDVRHHCLLPNWIGVPVVCREMLTKKEVTELQNSIEKELQVDKKTTSSYRRRKISAYDPRPSSKQIGLAGVVILTMCFSVIVILDCLQCHSKKSSTSNQNANTSQK